MNYLTAPLGSLSLIALLYMYYILANLSRRYGQVIRLPPYYRGFYVGMVLICVAFLSHLVQTIQERINMEILYKILCCSFIQMV